MKKTLQKSKKTGRKPLPAGEVREVDVRIRVTREEKNDLRNAAATDGQTLANWIRHRLGLEAAEYGG